MAVIVPEYAPFEVTLNVADVAPATIVTVAGNVGAPPVGLTLSVTVTPPAGAAPGKLNVIVPVGLVAVVRVSVLGLRLRAVWAADTRVLNPSA